jgi:hypothetical protein
MNWLSLAVRPMVAALVIVAAPLRADAQPAPSLPYEPHTRCTSLDFFGGVTTSDSDAGALLGGAMTWQATRWIALDGALAWLDRPEGESGFSAIVSAHVSLLSGEKALPFLRAGVGIYHAWFDEARWRSGDLPAFYRNRVHDIHSNMTSRHGFTDPVVAVGGGVNYFLSRNVALRPQAEALIVLRDSASYLVPTFTLHLAYHFTDRPITPARGHR